MDSEERTELQRLAEAPELARLIRSGRGDPRQWTALEQQLASALRSLAAQSEELRAENEELKDDLKQAESDLRGAMEQLEHS